MKERNRKMKHKEGFAIIGEKVVLVPYRETHVPRYHEWMSDPEVLRLTGSERLTLDEEFQMQKTWENDIDKCTFIILNRNKCNESHNEVDSMIGDTNLFLNADQDNPSSAEIEIMIADVSARRKGFATEALTLMMNFGRGELGKSKFIAKIKQDNLSSIKLFERLGFVYVSKSDVFQEVTLISDME